MKSDPIWYLLAEDALKRADQRPHNRAERLAFIEGAVAALETAAMYGMIPSPTTEEVPAWLP